MARIDNRIIEVRVSEKEEIPKGKITTVIYGRVSTTQSAQETSLKAQLQEAVRYAEEQGYFIIGIFVEKESGKNDVSREAYMAMLKCIEEYQPDYVLMKSSDRLARSVEVEYQFQRVCRNADTKIKYLLDRRTIDPNNSTDVMISTYESITHQQVSILQHEKGVEVVKRKRKNPWLSKNNECFGFRFDKQDGKMKVFEPEAVYIRKIFELYVFAGMGTTAIAKYLAENGVTGFKSNKLVSETGILKWLKNEAYIGKMHILTKTTLFGYGVGEKSKRINVPPEEHVIVNVPRIVDDELFELAQELMKSKTKMREAKLTPEAVQDNFRGKHLFAHTVYCGECGNSMLFKYTDRKKQIGVYKCSAKKKAKRKENNKNYSADDVVSCENPFSKVREEMLIDVVKKAVHCYAEHEEEIYDNLMEAVETVLSRQRDKKEKQSEILKKELETAKNEYTTTMKAYARTTVEELAKDLEMECQTLLNKIKFLKEQIEAEKELENVIIDNRFAIEAVRNRLSELTEKKEIDREFVMRYIDRILVNHDGKIEVHLKYNKIYSAILENNEKGQKLKPDLKLVKNVRNKSTTDMMGA